MIRKIRDWLLNKFLPAWAKESVHKENKALREKIKDIEAENKALNAYIDGLEAGLRTIRKITINNEVHK